MPGRTMREGEIRQRLEARRRELEALLRAQDARGWRESSTEATEALSSYDQHLADGATTTAQRTEELGLRRAAQAGLQEVEEALARLVEGRYGRCVRCGGAIGAERLEALPWAATCASCAGAAAAERDRQDREDPSGEAARWGRFALPGGQETWQALANMGTSGGPQDDYGGGVERDPLGWDGP